MTSCPCFIEDIYLKSYQKLGVHHGFFMRKGGVSSGYYESLNIGFSTKDDPKKILENRARVAKQINLNPEQLIFLNQIHSGNVALINKKNYQDSFQADSLVTKEKNLALCVMTADCGPILFYDYENAIIGAAHAGWRGALANIIENTIKAMETLGGNRKSIYAVLGPTIGPDTYEVTESFRETFLTENHDYKLFFKKTIKEKHYLFDLWQFILYKMRQANIKGSCLRICTYTHTNYFYSFRQKTHLNLPDCGRQLSFIVLR